MTTSNHTTKTELTSDRTHESNAWPNAPAQKTPTVAKILLLPRLDSYLGPSGQVGLILGSTVAAVEDLSRPLPDKPDPSDKGFAKLAGHPGPIFALRGLSFSLKQISEQWQPLLSEFSHGLFAPDLGVSYALASKPLHVVCRSLRP